jgi:hypothetical protein
MTGSTAGPDFSGVDSREKAETLCRSGVLTKLLLLPQRFGGQDLAQNVVYVPGWAADLKSSTDDGVIAALVADGKITRYAATPEYEGRSFVPIAIHITASEPGSFSQTIAIWGR